MTDPAGSMGIAEKMVSIHASLQAEGIAHAFGGALALAWCTSRARGTIDIDINVFVDPSETPSVVDGLPKTIGVSEEDQMLLRRDGQARLWWDATPIDVFLNTTEFHDEVATRVRWEPLMDEELPFLACDDLGVFKAFFNRTKDWADLEEMCSAGSLDIARVVGVITSHLGVADERTCRLLALRDGGSVL